MYIKFGHLTSNYLIIYDGETNKFSPVINPYTGRYLFNSCRMGKLFSENLQNRGYVQTSQLIIYKKHEKPDNLISNCVL